MCGFIISLDVALLAVAAYFSLGGGVVADVFPPEERGAASGLFMIPLLIGPIVGPLLGGGLAQAFGWRSTFICLTVFAGKSSVSIQGIIVSMFNFFRDLITGSMMYRIYDEPLRT